jgi:hypothetical protein
MEENGHLTRLQAKKESAFLEGVAKDTARDPFLRANAINALGILKIDEAAPTIRGMLKDRVNLNDPYVARPACLALWRIEGEKSLTAERDILQSTEEVSVYGTAAFALGQIKVPESMAALVNSASRFPDSGSCDAALVEMEGVVLQVLGTPDHANLIQAIGATRHLWKDGQSDHYIPLLRQLLSTAQLEGKKAALDRLLDYAGTLDFQMEKALLETTLPLIAKQPELDGYRERIQQRLSATVVAPTGATVPTPSQSPRGN